MSNIAAGDVTYTLVSQGRNNQGKNDSVYKLTFGNGALTYPAGGVPLTKGNLGCPNVIDSLIVFESLASAVGYMFQYEKVTESLVMLQSPSHAHDILLKDATVADGATTRLNAAANKLGANTGGDLTITGAGANGGVVNSTALKLSQPSTVAIAAQSIHCRVVGW